MHIAYLFKYSKGEKGQRVEFLHAFECYSCQKFHSIRYQFEKHLNCCSQTAGIIYKFDNKTLVSFEDNYRILQDLPFVVYFDYETTPTPTFSLTRKCI